MEGLAELERPQASIRIRIDFESDLTLLIGDLVPLHVATTQFGHHFVSIRYAGNQYAHLATHRSSSLPTWSCGWGAPRHEPSSRGTASTRRSAAAGSGVTEMTDEWMSMVVSLGRLYTRILEPPGSLQDGR